MITSLRFMKHVLIKRPAAGKIKILSLNWKECSNLKILDQNAYSFSRDFSIRENQGRVIYNDKTNILAKLVKSEKIGNPFGSVNKKYLKKK